MSLGQTTVTKKNK